MPASRRHFNPGQPSFFTHSSVLSVDQILRFRALISQIAALVSAPARDFTWRIHCFVCMRPHRCGCQAPRVGWISSLADTRCSLGATRETKKVSSVEVFVRPGERSACAARVPRLSSPRSGRGESRRIHTVGLSRVLGPGLGSSPSSGGPPTNTGSGLMVGFVAALSGAGEC
jgi:hypothetical protein